MAFSVRRDDAIAAAMMALLFLGHLLFGATQDFAALLLADLHIAFAVAMLLARRFRRRLSMIPLRAVAWPFALLLVVGIVDSAPLGPSLGSGYWQLAPHAPAAISLDPFASRLGVVQLVGYAALFLVGLMLAADDRGARRLIELTMLTALAFSVWAFVDHLDDPRFIPGMQRQLPGRLSATFGSANTAATLFGSFTVIALVQLMRGSECHGGPRFSAGQALPLLLLLFAASCLFLTASRAGVAATLAAAVAGLLGSAWLAYRESGRRPRALAIAAAASAGLVLLLLLSGEQLATRTEGWASDSRARAALNALFWDRVFQAPWLGHGVGSFWAIATTSVTASNAELMFNTRAAHNFYLQWLLQAGFVGALAMFATLAAITYRLLRGLVKRHRGQRQILTIAAVLLLFLLHATADFSLEVPSVAAYLALLLGAGYAVATPTADRQLR